MNRSMKHFALAAAAASFALAAGCEHMPWNKNDTKKMDASAPAAVAKVETAKAASTQPSWGKPAGTVTFTSAGEGKVKVSYDLDRPAARQARLPHPSEGRRQRAGPQFGRPALQSRRPQARRAEGREPPRRRPRNIEADTSGNAKGHETVDGISIGTGGADDIVGKSVIVHEKADDMKTDPSGASGGAHRRGVIEAKKIADGCHGALRPRDRPPQTRVGRYGGRSGGWA
jgi:Cu-Zn family superoxide dismutase